MDDRTKIRILIVLYYYHPYVSGLSLLAKAQAEGLAARGYQVTILTTRHEKGLASSENINGVRVVRANILARASKGVLSFDFLGKIITFSKSHDIVNPHLPMVHFGLVLPFIDTGKLIPQYHCDLDLGPGLLQRLIERFSYWSMARTLASASKIIVTTKDYFGHCRFAEHISRACEIYPPIVQARFVKRNSDNLRIRLCIEGNPYLIGFVGRIVAEKGLEYLLQAIPYLEEQGKDCLLLIAGDHAHVAGGSIMGRINALAGQFPGRVRFVGHLSIDDLVAFYNMIDVLVLPSVNPLEAFGMVQVEAMLCGTPVIATDMPGVREVINKTRFGKLIQKRSPQDIAEKIVELIDKPLYASKERLADFDYERSIDRYEEVFGELLEKR